MKEINYIEEFQARGKITLSNFKTDIDLGITEEKAIKKLDKTREKLSKFQDKMYAHNRYSVLICIQGMDTAGKDSLIREVFKEFNARGVVVQSFKTPTSTELEHDYLWRHYIALPEKGKFSVFNRTHYENVLVTRVHPEYLLRENIPGIESVADIPANFWKQRFEQINHFENHLIQNGVIVLKFFLHLGKDEQKKRLLRRLDKKKHNWKFSPGDLTERALWERYMEYYEEAISHTSGKTNPWYIVPADNKAVSRLILAKIIEQTLAQYTDIKEAELDPTVEAHIECYRQELTKD